MAMACVEFLRFLFNLNKGKSEGSIKWKAFGAAVMQQTKGFVIIELTRFNHKIKHVDYYFLFMKTTFSKPIMIFALSCIMLRGELSNNSYIGQQEDAGYSNLCL
ncbi:hypothetical protein BDA99DRAFT_540732 [Phascolomyces articulosus]|uniref:Uncharacterized protein n=1 Tax=Phascolomyces articulosus TaxID=60185 RepID=A0AAD5PAX3_9FUNG|nr:hypothetical protein BDA99DRAFT_540732 [Phascolomyces articulosus]